GLARGAAIAQKGRWFDTREPKLLKCAVSLEGFPRGQREQTVNLPALPSKVRILPTPPRLGRPKRRPNRAYLQRSAEAFHAHHEGWIPLTRSTMGTLQCRLQSESAAAAAESVVALRAHVAQW